MANKDDDKKGLAMVRSVETRIVWFGTFLVCMAKGSLASSAAKIADEGVDEYQRRHDAFKPDDLPAG